MMNIAVKMIDGNRSFFILHNQSDNPNQTNWFDVRYPYKAIYGLPNSLKCQQSIYDRFDQCEKTSESDWKITIDEYVSYSNKYIMDDFLLFNPFFVYSFMKQENFVVSFGKQ